MKLANVFTIMLTLTGRHERKQWGLDQLRLVGVTPFIIHGVLPPNKGLYPSRAYRGATESHIAALAIAVVHRATTVMIVEDDLVLEGHAEEAESFYSTVQKLFHPPDLLYFHNTHNDGVEVEQGFEINQPVWAAQMIIYTHPERALATIRSRPGAIIDTALHHGISLNELTSISPRRTIVAQSTKFPSDTSVPDDFIVITDVPELNQGESDAV